MGTSFPGLCDLATTAPRAGPRAELKCKLGTAVHELQLLHGLYLIDVLKSANFNQHYCYNCYSYFRFTMETGIVRNQKCTPNVRPTLLHQLKSIKWMEMEVDMFDEIKKMGIVAVSLVFSHQEMKGKEDGFSPLCH